MRILAAVLSVLALALASPVVPAALADCASPVWDRTGNTLTSTDPDLSYVATQLTDLGADVHLIVFGPTTSVATAEAQLEQACPSWLGPSGVRASTLLVLGVSPSSHKSWITYGSAWHHALDDNFNRIRTDDMNPFFKNKEWVKGLSAGADALRARITAAKDESLHPAETKVEATDLKPVANVLVIIFEVAGGILALGFLWWWVASRTEKKRKARAAQQTASTVRSNLASRMQQLDMDIAAYAGDKKVVEAMRDRLSEDFSRYSNSEKTNPDTPGFSEGEYKAIQDIYSGLVRNLEACYRIMNPNLPEPSVQRVEHTPWREIRTQQSTRGKGAGIPQTPQPTQPSTVVVQTGNSSSFSDGFLGGMLGSEISNSGHSERNRDRDDYVAPAPSYDPPSSSSSSSWNSGSSSSDSGGGGGSDWSSSSDSGGGGGSDFSSSSDSGGGGGGDF